jgi:hypothetical protein
VIVTVFVTVVGPAMVKVSRTMTPFPCAFQKLHAIEANLYVAGGRSGVTVKV